MIQLIQLVFLCFNILIIGRILVSFLNLSPYSPVVQVLYRTTEPFLAPVRRVLPPMAGFDFSPMIVIVAASLVEQILIRALLGI